MFCTCTIDKEMSHDSPNTTIWAKLVSTLHCIMAEDSVRPHRSKKDRPCDACESQIDNKAED